MFSIRKTGVIPHLTDYICRQALLRTRLHELMLRRHAMLCYATRAESMILLQKQRTNAFEKPRGAC